MGNSNVKKEKKEHGSLLDLLKKHFSKDEEEMDEYDNELGSVMKQMPVYKGARRGRQESPYDAEEEFDEDYDSDPDMDLPVDMLEDGEDSEEDEDDEFEDGYDEKPTKPSKDQRKKMSIVALGKKFSKA